MAWARNWRPETLWLSVKGVKDSMIPPPPRTPKDQSAPKGFRVRLGSETERELRVLGCGWRIVTCQFRGENVHLHHNGYTATMERKAFKELLAANRRLRRKRPALRLVASNPPKATAVKEAAA